jgi:hypothetical protein
VSTAPLPAVVSYDKGMAKRDFVVRDEKEGCLAIYESIDETSGASFVVLWAKVALES